MGSWIFLSHSSHDIDKVRILRNAFEAEGQNPLAFHLKCLNTDTQEGRMELEGLIKREIESRDWFVFCDSPAARRSEYVQMETEYIKKVGKQKIWVLDMTKPLPELLSAVKEICSKTRVFLSYARTVTPFARLLSEALERKDYSVWWDEKLSVGGGAWGMQVRDKIDEASRHGFSVLLMDEQYVRSEACMQELSWILQSRSEVIPILVGGVKRPEALSKTTCYSIPTAPRAEDIYLIVQLSRKSSRAALGGLFVIKPIFTTSCVRSTRG